MSEHSIHKATLAGKRWWTPALIVALSLWGFGCDDKTTTRLADATVGGESGDMGGIGGDAGEGGGGGGEDVACFEDGECADDQFCDIGDAVVGTCADGCRLDACGEGEFCDPSSRTCEEERCTRDVDCADGEYCSPDGCTPGCRTMPDNCEPQGGITFRCDEMTRQCAPLVACCSEDNTCALGVANQCQGSVLPNTTSCANDPCGALCDDNNVDEVCGPDEYCNADGRCERGCREGAQDPDGTACPEGEACNPDTRLCEEITCQADTDCEEGFYCDINVGEGTGTCAEGCRIGGDDCANGLTCDANHVCRAFCNADFPCPDQEGFYCDEVAEICRARCAAHDDCISADEFCNITLGQCEEGCRDDLDHEPNNGLEDATPLNLVVGQVSTGQRTLCPADDDYYAIDVPEGGRIRITLDFEQAPDPNVPGDLQLALFGPDGMLIESQTNLVAPEVILWPAALDQGAPAGNYSVRVYGAADDVTNQYDLTIEVAGGDGEPACFLDEFDLAEPNDDFSDDARLIGLRPGGGVEVFEQSICGDDTDWFTFPISPDDGTEIELTALPGSTPVLVQLFSPNRVNNVAQPNYTTVLEDGAVQPDGSTVWTLNLAEGTGAFDDSPRWFARVVGADDETIANYRLSINFNRADPCAADALENNDAIGLAPPLEDQVLPDALDAQGRFLIGVNHSIPVGLRLCPRDRDYFTIRANEFDVLTASVVIEGNAGGDMQVQFVRDGVPQGVIGRGRIGQINAFYQVPAGAAGDVAILVSGVVDQASANYELVVRRQPSDGGNCDLDPENDVNGQGRNDTRGSATTLANNNRAVFENMQLCGQNGVPDEDWYEILVPEDNARISASVQFINEFGNIDLELYYEDQIGRTSESITARNGELIDRALNLGQAGTYYLRVFNNGGQVIQNTYNLTITAVPVLPCPLEERICPGGGNACADGERICAEAYFCAPDYREGETDNDDSARATSLGSGDVFLGDTWICGGNTNETFGERGPNVGDWFELEVPPGAHRTVAVTYLEATDGEVRITAVARNPDDDVLPQTVFASRSTNMTCLNIRGGQLNESVLINAFNVGRVPDEEQRVDYSLYVVETDLDANPDGECDLLSPVDNPQPVDPLTSLPLNSWSEVTLP
ncbi:MAG: hypothetical protein ACE366_25310 [Bradymonadia bacterium]